MRLSFLKHLLDSVGGLVRPDRIVVLGSGSLLAYRSDLGEQGQPLEVSLDADLLLDPIDEATAAVLKEAVGRDSLFQQRHGYYADILRPDITETLPLGWESRLVPVPGYTNVFALACFSNSGIFSTTCGQVFQLPFAGGRVESRHHEQASGIEESNFPHLPRPPRPAGRSWRAGHSLRPGG